jgi:hypothetical protein
VPALGHEDIAGLDVPVDDARSMGGIKGVGDLNAKRQCLLDLQRFAADAVFQRHSIKKLHDDERMTIVLPNLMDRADVGMIESGGGTSLATKAF